MMARTIRVTRLVLYATMAICSAALLMVEGTAGDATSVLGENVISGHEENATSVLEEDVISGHEKNATSVFEEDVISRHEENATSVLEEDVISANEKNATSVFEEDVISGREENATTAVLIGHPATLAVEGNPPHRGPRQVEQRDQRCALPSFIGGGSSSDGTADTVLESTRTVDRYLVKPAAYYENRVTYREKPAVANLLIRRRRPVPVQRIGLLPYYVQRMDFADLGHRPPEDEPTAVSMTADDVRRLLQRVYSEGVIAGGEVAATASPNFDSKVLPLKG